MIILNKIINYFTPKKDIVQSPCISVCSIDENIGFCEGCYRTLNEIEDWQYMKSSERRQIIKKIEQRLLELVRENKN